MIPEYPIALVGLRASGKSTVGRALSELMACEFVDLDDEITRGAGRRGSAGDVLAELGLDAFRDLEAAMLERVLARPGAFVIATGGGVVERADNRRRLAERAIVVWLDADVSVLQERLRSEHELRPALTGRGTVEEVPEIAARRAPLYAAVAQLVVASGSRSPRILAGDIVARLAGAGLTPGIRRPQPDG